MFLLALANAKAHYNQADASIYFTQATSHLGQLVSGTHGTKRYVPAAETQLVPQRPTLVTFIE